MSDEQNQTDETEVQPTEKQLLMERARKLGITFSNNITVDKLKAKINEKLTGETSEVDQIDEDGDGHDDIDGTFVDGNTVAASEAQDEEMPLKNPADLAPLNEAVTTPPPPLADPKPLVTPVNTQETAPVAPTAPARPLSPAQKKMARRKALRDEQMALLRVRVTNMNPAKKDLPGEIFTVANEILGNVKKFIPYGEQTDNGYHIPRCLFTQLEEKRFQQIRTVKDKRTGVLRPETRWVKEFALEVLPPLTQEELQRLATAQAAAGSVDEFIA